jgi:hypothetical protein
MTQLRTVTTLLILLVIFCLTQASAIAQGGANQGQPQKATRTITADQAATISKILAKYDSKTMTATQAKKIHEQFREAGIHAGPETNDAILVAGFDPEKLRTLDPPPARHEKNNGAPPTLEERLKIVEDKITKPLSLDSGQSAKVIAAFRLFYLEREKLKNTSSNSDARPDREKVDALVKARDESIRSAIPESAFEKYRELEKSMHPHPPQVEKEGKK